MLFIYLGLSAGACSPAAQVFKTLDGAGGKGEPTSMVLTYRTPKPSETPRVVNTPLPTATQNYDPDYYYGGLTVTMDYVGQTVPLRKGQSFLLDLGEAYEWQVEVGPEDIISQNVKITPEPGEQGVFVARERGKAVLHAVGEPACHQAQPPCERPSVLFQVDILVE